MNESKSMDIWAKGVKTIVGHHKKSLLDYADALRNGDANVEKAIGSLKAKIHNDLSQIQFSVGVLFETYKSGGDIKPFEDSFRADVSTQQPPRRPDGHHNQVQRPIPAGSK